MNSLACILPLLTPALILQEQFLNLNGKKNKILGYHKDRPCSIYVQSFVYLTNDKEGNKTQL